VANDFAKHSTPLGNVAIDAHILSNHDIPLAPAGAK
jgi:hypothetical protein